MVAFNAFNSANPAIPDIIDLIAKLSSQRRSTLLGSILFEYTLAGRYANKLQNDANEIVQDAFDDVVTQFLRLHPVSGWIG